MANEALFKRIEFFQRLTHYGKREDFLDSLAQVAPATEPKFTKEQEDQYYGSQLAKSKPTALPKPISLHTEKPAQPPLYTQPNQQPAKQKTVAPAPDLQKQLQDAFGPNYVPPAKQAQVRQPTTPEFDSEQVKPLLDLDEFGNPKQEGIPAPPAATREPTRLRLLHQEIQHPWKRLARYPWKRLARWSRWCNRN